MNINVFYNMTNFVLNKAQTGNASPSRFNLAIDIANRSLFKEYEGIPQVGDKGGNAMTYSESTDIEQVMRLFKQPVVLYIDSKGFTNTPSDFVRESTLTYNAVENGITNYNSVKICNDIEFQEARYSYVVTATKDNPVCRFIGTQIQFLPVNLINVNMTYLRMPKTPVWAFTITNNRPVYDATNSVDIEFPDDVIQDLLFRTVQFLGLNMQKQMVVQFAEQFKQNGQ